MNAKRCLMMCGTERISRTCRTIFARLVLKRSARLLAVICTTALTLTACRSEDRTRTIVIDSADGPAYEVVYETDRRPPGVGGGPPSRGEGVGLLVLRIHMFDAPNHCTEAEIAGYLYDDPASLRGLWEEASHGQATIAPIDIATVSVARDATPCNPAQWANEADRAARRINKDPNSYAHVMYVMPLPTFDSCRASGSAEQPGERSWVYICDMPDVYPHELGHNFGLGHSGKDFDNDGVIENAYDDRSCPMGYNNIGWRHFNIVQKERLGWGAAQVVSEPGYYHLEPLESGADQLKVGPYYVSRRAVIGPNSVDLLPEFQTETSIHEARRGVVALLATLATGETFRGASNVNITQTAEGEVWIGLDVVRAAPPICPVGDPVGCGPIEHPFNG